ncbi:MAG TPA: porin [Pasteurellaceae bacterium]|nr:porin [Pasteurellaceae bacterium]
MKKTLLAALIGLAAINPANAATIYNQDGTKVEIKGSVRMLLQKVSQRRTDLKDADSELIFRVEQNIGNGFSALANTEIRFTKNGTIGDEVFTKYLYAGFKHDDIGTLTFGKQLTTGDDVGLSDYTYNLGGINKVLDASDKVIHFRSVDFYGFNVGADYVFGDATKKDSNNDETANTNGYVVGLFYNKKFGELGFAVDAGFSRNKKSETGLKADEYYQDGFTIGSQLSYGSFAFAVDYAYRKAEGNNAVSWRTASADRGGKVINQTTEGFKFNRIREVEIGAKYQVTERSKVYADYIWGRAEQADGSVFAAINEPAKLNAYIAGIDYRFNQYVVTYLEVGRFRYKFDGATYRKDDKYGIGMRVYF